MSDPNVPGFDPGGIADRVDERDYQFNEVGAASAPFDWNTGYDIETVLGTKLPVKDQGPSFSCGGQAWSTYAGVLEAVATNSLEERSAKFFYAQTYQKGGGSTGRDNANIFINQGACQEKFLVSYENGNSPSELFMTRGQDITDGDRNDALLDRGYSYAQTGTSIDTIAQALRDNNGVVILLDGQNNGTWASDFPKPPTKTEWRHWVYVGKAKMINRVKYVGILNSWGKDIGENGWQWLSESYFTTGHILSGWTHVLQVPPPTIFHHNFVFDLHFGDTNVDIQSLQTALQIDSEFPKTVPPSGFYGDITRRSVLAFRVKYNISSSTDPLGKSVGPLTRQKLNSIFN